MFLTPHDRRINFTGSLILITITLVTGLFVYVIMQRQSEHILDMSLLTLSQHKVQILETQILEGVNDTRIAVISPILMESLQRGGGRQGNASKIADLQQQANLLLLKGYLAVSIYDGQGTNVVQAGQLSQVPTESLTIHTKDAMTSLWWNKALIQRTQMEILNQEGQHIGRVITEKNQPLLTKLLYESNAIGESGELMLCTSCRESELAMECFLMSASKVQFQHLPRAIGGDALPMDYALRGMHDVLRAKDYRQIPVVAAHAPIGTFDLGLVVKVDKEELYRPIAERVKEITVILVLLMAIALWLLNWQVMPLVRKLIRSEQEIEKININLRKSKETIEQNFTELTNYNEAVGKLALVSIADREGRIIQVNSKFCEVSGYHEEELIGKDHRLLNSGIHPKVFWVEMWKTISCGDSWHSEICNRSKQGELYWVDTTIVPLRESSGRIYRYLSVRVDITTRKQNELALCQQLKERDCLQVIRHEMSVEPSVDKLCQQILLHLTAAVQYPEIAAAKIELGGEQFVSTNYVENLTHQLHSEVIINGKRMGQLQLFYLHDKPFLLPEEQNLIDIITTDLSRWYERKLADQRISYLATHDNLTGLPNWHLLHDRVTQVISHAGRHRKQAAILFIDLDRFKIINDSLGHEMGDLLLKETAIRLRSCVRAEDTVARQGGDEFIVLLQGINDHQDAGAVAKKVLEAIMQPYPISGKKLHIGCSIGIAMFPDDGGNADTLLKSSDIAMYHAKEIGRNNFRNYSA